MQGFLTIQSINPNENFLFMGNRKKASIEGIGTYRLILDSGYHLDLPQNFYVPSLSRNLVSVLKLDVNGFSFKIEKGCFSLFNKDDSFIGSGTLMDGLYRLKLDVDFSASLMCVHQNIGIKCIMANKNTFGSYIQRKATKISKE